MKATITTEKGESLELENVSIHITGVFVTNSGNPMFGGDGNPKQDYIHSEVVINGIAYKNNKQNERDNSRGV